MLSGVYSRCIKELEMISIQWFNLENDFISHDFSKTVSQAILLPCYF